MKLIGLTSRALPTRLLERRRAALGERVADVAWREGLRRWKSGRRARDHFVAF